MRIRAWLRRWGPAAVMMAVIFAASSLAKADVPQFSGIWDLLVKKTGHLLAYALLGLAYLRGLRGDRPVTPAWMVAAILLAALYGATDEFHKSFVAGRGATLVDVLIDTLGAMLGMGVRAGARVWARG